MTTLSSLSPSQIRMLARLDAAKDAKAPGLLAWKVHTADMGVIMSLMKLELVEVGGFETTRRRFRLTSEGLRVREAGSAGSGT